MKFLSYSQRLPSSTRWAVLFLLAALVGCDRGQVQEYRVAKEQTQMQAPPAAMPPGHPDTSGSAPPALQYKLPAEWQEVAPGQMRAASFRVPGKDGKQADVSVIPLPGLAGSDLDNVNRWRGQVGLPGVSEAELATLAQPVEIAGQSAKLYEQAGANPGSGEKSRILAAITRRAGVAWFFKMTGEDGLVAEQKPAFIEFLKSVTFPAASAQAQLPPSHPPIGGGSMVTPAGAAASSGQAKPNWEVPSGWKEIPGGQFLVAKFALAGDGNAQANVNVSMSSGDGGGMLANVNRWRTQLSLGPEAEVDLSKELQSLDLPGGKATLVDISGQDARTGQKARLLAVVVPRSGDTWFYKLMGDAQIVEREKEAFMKFVQTVKY
ncbi:MAG: hypothetical protein ACLQU3_28210 [Limisphaerales bacterium]